MGARKKEAVDHPAHYNTGSIEVIAAIDDWRLSFSLDHEIARLERSPAKAPRS